MMAPKAPNASSVAPADVNANSRKRSRDSEECGYSHARVKLSPIETSSASEPATSEDSALVPTSVSDGSTAASDVDTDSESELEESSDDTSSESSSEEVSDEESDEESSLNEENEDEIINLIANKGNKPVIKFPRNESAAGLRLRLKGFLPQLAAANEQLEKERKAGTLKKREIEKDGEAEGEYIEMNLGLGVLEHKNSKAQDSETDGGGETHDGNSDAEGRPAREKDIFGKLMGRDKKESVGIQEVDDT
ncbi:hypothetical protein K469DRAFT_747428 [Zopfia rhizophila CBS 207.26]|uniref:Uncharacterized protein n=1 Tax=Zopfia rhizophila CBS 207.26 TaxID=1314779 RepID=A0A6A6EEP6_9PEZI|nr:hypothetical protein K469DRAFT_747428 [Zopfia rhizophila CBS 207.26]